LDRTVEGYLAELKRQLAGADPALTQDAVYDAEEYLRSAIAEAGGDPQAAFDAAVEAYGAPDEVAASYRSAELTVAAALRSPRSAANTSSNPFARFFGVVADPQAWGAFFYMLLALATGIIYFTIVVTGVSLSFGTAILIIGIPIALIVLAIVRAVSFAEGRMVEGLLGVRMPRRPRTVGVQGTVLARIKGWLTDWHTWTTMLYMLMQLPLGVVYFTAIVTGLSVSAALVAAPFVQGLTNEPVMRTLDSAYFIEPAAYPLFVIVGALGFIVTLWLAKGVGFLHGIYAKAMLVGGGEQAAPAVPAAPSAPVSPVAPASPAPPAEGGE